MTSMMSRWLFAAVVMLLWTRALGALLACAPVDEPHKVPADAPSPGDQADSHDGASLTAGDSDSDVLTSDGMLAGDGQTQSLCGNFRIDEGEVCEVGNLDGRTCTTIGGSFDGGDLACDPHTCRWDTRGCTLPVCWGPAEYAVSGVPDHYPCNLDSDCDGECLWEFNTSLYTELGFCDGAPSGYPQSTTIDDVPLGAPCYRNADCMTGYCFWGRGISLRTSVNVCVFPCTPGDSHDASYLCVEDPVVSNTYACSPVSGTGSQGATCLAAEYDCAESYLCLHGFCSRLNCDTSGNPCPEGSSCTSVDDGFGPRSVCVPSAAVGSLATGAHCIHNTYCENGTCTNQSCL